MNYFDDESKIIEMFQGVGCESVALLPEAEELEEIFLSIHEQLNWKQWIDSSGKADAPPDFYCPQRKLMMDVMRVDDHTFINKKGQLVNPTNALESAMQKELRGSGILEQIPNLGMVFVEAITDLPTEEDHNYKFYLDNFTRIVGEHKRKIDLYRRNHPNFKTIFFIFDESSAYVEALEKPEEIYKGKVCEGKAHYWFFDKLFLNAFLNSDIDYVIWYTPFKLIRVIEKMEIALPKAVVIDVKKLTKRAIDYNIENMVSCEV